MKTDTVSWKIKFSETDGLLALNNYYILWQRIVAASIVHEIAIYAQIFNPKIAPAGLLTK